MFFYHTSFFQNILADLIFARNILACIEIYINMKSNFVSGSRLC